MQVLDHFVLVFDVLFDFFQILWCFSEVFFLQVVHWLGNLFCCGKNVFDGVCNDEIFVAFKAVDWTLFVAGDLFFFVCAVV